MRETRMVDREEKVAENQLAVKEWK